MRPLVDAFGHNPYPTNALEPPAAVHAPGFVGEGDYARLVRVLRGAFGRTPEIWYLEDGFQSSVPARLQSHYDGHENVSTITPAQQARQLALAIRLASCQPRVHAFFNFELVDEHASWAGNRGSSGAACTASRRRPPSSSSAASRVRVSIDSAPCAGSVGSRRGPVQPPSSD